MKIVLAGSPQIALATFEKIIRHFDVCMIISQPDRKQGRGKKLMPTPVSQLALKHHILLRTPERIAEVKAELNALNYDLLITFAYGQKIPDQILQIGTHQPVNIHASLLPKYRGAAPIQRAILDGAKAIGITLMQMASQIDAGAILFQAKIAITPTTSSYEAFNLISDLAQNHIVDWIKQVKLRQVNPQIQSKSYTLAPKISKSEAEIKPTTTLDQAKRMIKAFNPAPGAFMLIDHKRVKLYNYAVTFKPGMLKIKLFDGILFINEFLWAGSKKQIIT